VLINRYIADISDRCIYLNNELGGYLATRHLIELGHREIAYISGPSRKHDATERLEGHKRALAEVGLFFDAALCYEGDYREDSGAAGMLYLLGQAKKFTAVVCANDQMVSGAIYVCQKAGMTVPDDLSFVGFDNIPFARYVSPQLTTVNNPIHEMGKMAALWLLKNVYNKDIVVEHVFEPELVVRNSAVKRRFAV
jgi:LacI family transcriptional regulator